MKNTVLVVLLVFLAISCDKSEVLKNKKIVISGNVQLTDSLELDKITIYGYDMTRKQSFQEDAIVQENGNFSFNIDLKRANSLTFYGNNSFQILAIPGDTINVNYTESKDLDVFNNSIKFNGRLARTQERFQQYLNNNPLKTDTFYTENNDLDYTDLEAFIGNKQNDLKKHYKEFLDDKTSNKFLKNYIEADKKYAIANLKMDYIAYSTYYGKKVPEMNSAYYEFLNNMPKLEEEDLVNTTAVNNMLANNYSFASREIEKRSPEATPQEINQAIIDTAIKKDSYLNQHTVSMLIMGDLNDHSVDLYESNSDQIMDYFKDSSLLTSIQEEYLKTKELIDKPQLPEETELLTFKTDDASKFIEEIIANATGKVIYIDNWATWCGPCKAEFKEASPALHEKFKKDVEFIYLCHESKESAYLPSIAEFKIKGKHYFLTKEQGNIVQRQIKLEGFPTYTIIDKEGNQVLSDYIHRPSYGATSDILTKLVENKELDTSTFTQ
ncbi:MAG: thioredoxin-like domain-containing protein [Nonlabens sp.]|uniref:thioredoxin-like domain-containing protein n=1 Tax=Nonlabens sp. TaxID=1888209 RepID=UPI00321BECC6